MINKSTLITIVLAGVLGTIVAISSMTVNIVIGAILAVLLGLIFLFFKKIKKRRDY